MLKGVFLMEKLIISFVMGAFGMGYFVYGKKQCNFVALFSGIGLFIAPYFTDNIYILSFSGVCLLLFPFFIKI